MVQVVSEYREAWPAAGSTHLQVRPLEAEIPVSPTLARRRAKGYLTAEAALAFRPGDPILIWGQRRVWRMPVHLHLRGFGSVAVLGTIDVDAMTRDAAVLDPTEIAAMQERATEIAAPFREP
jgi:hypothetical protein